MLAYRLLDDQCDSMCAHTKVPVQIMTMSLSMHFVIL